MSKKDTVKESQSFEERLLKMRLKKSKEKNYLLDDESTKAQKQQKRETVS